ncbi:MAG TPA: DEAD/DEAH box helicase family protein, partial [Flavipsychrobacter sp.]
EVRQATTGASEVAVKKYIGQPLTDAGEREFLKDSSLLGMMLQKDDSIITTVVNKFESVLRKSKAGFIDNNIFILVDEGHRSHYGPMGVKVKQVFPNASFLAFTGTPLMKKEKNTAAKFGGLIDIYSIKDAVEDEQVKRLLYEGRHNILNVNEKPLDNFFDKVSEPLTDYGKADLKRKFSTRNAIVQSDSFIESTAWDITNHFVDTFQGTGLKGQLVAPNKKSALRYREKLKEIGKIDVALLISGPDMREGEEDAFEQSDDKLKSFWQAMMDKYGSEKQYNKSVINSFKYDDKPEIIIVVDKLLTGFDAPRNTVLYLTRQLKEHTLLQAIARVNRVYPGKDYGYILDYYGNLEHLDDALETYSGLEDYDTEDLRGALVKMSEEIEELPQAHSELWDVFKQVGNKYDTEAYEQLLRDEAIRYVYYEKLSAFVRLLKLAFSNYEWTKSTPESQVNKYRSDAKFFLALRVSVKRRYQDAIDYKEYEKQVQKLIDKHITSDGEVMKVTGLVDIFNKEAREAEVEKITGKAAKADHIASRTIKAISLKMTEGHTYLKRLSELIKETIEEFRQHRIDEAEYLSRTKSLEKEFLNGNKDSIPTSLRGNETAIAYFNLIKDEFKDALAEKDNKDGISEKIALAIDEVVQSNVFYNSIPIVDWFNNNDIIGKLRIDLDDLIFDFKEKYHLHIQLTQIDSLVADIEKITRVKFAK